MYMHTKLTHGFSYDYRNKTLNTVQCGANSKLLKYYNIIVQSLTNFQEFKE